MILVKYNKFGTCLYINTKSGVQFTRHSNRFSIHMASEKRTIWMPFWMPTIQKLIWYSDTIQTMHIWQLGMISPVLKSPHKIIIIFYLGFVVLWHPSCLSWMRLPTLKWSILHSIEGNLSDQVQWTFEKRNH